MGIDLASKPPSLTRRQQQVLTLIARGQSTSKISVALGIKQRTVHAHAADIIRRLGARNRPSAVALAIKDGLIAYP